MFFCPRGIGQPINVEFPRSNVGFFSTNMQHFSTNVELFPTNMHPDTDGVIDDCLCHQFSLQNI